MRNLHTFQNSICHWKNNVLRIKQQHQKIIRRSILLECYESVHSNIIPDNIDDLVRAYAHQPQTSVSLQNLMRTGQGEYLHKLKTPTTATTTATTGESKSTTDARILIQVSNFIRRELPIRLAHRIHDLDSAPLFCDMPSVKEVRETYIKTFHTMINTKVVETIEEEEEFAKLVGRQYDRHSNVLIQMARGAFELREAVRNGTVHIQDEKYSSSKGGGGMVRFEQMNASHDFLDRFYMTRIGMRVLLGQYLALRQSTDTNLDDGYVGLINLQTNPYELVQHAADDAALICCRKYGDAPDVNIQGRLDLTFPYIPTHLHYIALELIKNSMRATVDFHGVDNDLPSIDVIIANGKDNEDVVIKVEDKGGGIPRSDMPKIWSYLFTTADPVIQEGLVAFSSKNSDHSIDSPLAGLGYGLPISRSYARYFGGDLSMMSMEGYGTDAFIYLKRLGNAKEPVPI